MSLVPLGNFSVRRRPRERLRVGAASAILVLAALGVPATPARAASLSASLTAISETALTLRPGETRAINVTFKNTGATAWRKSGANYVSLYTWDPKYHASAIAASDWRSSKQTGALAADVAAGKKGELTLTVKAPALPGTYHENFQLAAENLAWISGGRFGLAVTVTAGAPVASSSGQSPPPTPAPTLSPPSPTGTLSATRLLMSAQRLTLKGGERADFTVLYKNNGTRPWNVRRLVMDQGLRIAAGDAPTFYDSSWPSASVALSIAEAVNPGNTAYARFSLKAPPTRGEYTARFKLVADDEDVPGGAFDLPVSVTDDAPTAVNPEPGPGANPLSVTVPLIPEPTVRVGAATISVNRVPVSSDGVLSIQDSSGAELATLPVGVTATVSISPGGSFQISGAGAPVTVSGIIRFVPAAGADGVTRVGDGQNSEWKSWVDGARLRGTVEIRYYPPADVTWVINELPIEKYLYGLAETGNSSPYEYQKALITAARTYAYWHLTHPGKHVTFTVDATYDQVYRGANRERNQPNIVRAVEETRGAIVHYNGAPAATPYFANSDGRTRSNKEVWGTDKPWLVSVEAPYDKGKQLWGHGVGLSGRDAAYRADEDKWTWDQILKYYYTGVEVKKLW